MVLYVCSLWSDRKDLYDNGEPTDAIRSELNRAEGAKQDIAGTASNIEGTKEQVQNLKTQSEQLQTQVQTLNQSLTNANQLLTQYENNQQINKEKNYAIGLGIGNNGIAIAGDIKNTWIVADEKTVILGYKFKF